MWIKNTKWTNLPLFIQVMASVIFMVALCRLGMLPTKYHVVIVGVLIIIWAVLFILRQKLKKNEKVIGVMSLFVSIVLFAVAFFVGKTTTAMEKMNENSKENVLINSIVVAVSVDDSAKYLEDTKDYAYGVQYTLKGNEIRESIAAINDELKKEVLVIEFANIQEQMEGLYEGEVQAIVFNEAYLGLLEEEFPDVGEKIRIIYTVDLEKQIELDAAQEGLAENQELTEQNSFIVYISGIDIHGSIKKTSRSDVNILAVVNPTSHQVLLVTTPRDYYVEFPGISGNRKDKLTHASIYGVDVSMETLGNLYDVDIDYYVRVNFTSMVKIVDAIGGIDVNSEYSFQSKTFSNETVYFKKGENHLNGEQALAFCRERKNIPDGDFQRGKNQQAVISAIIQKALSPSILTGATEIMDSIAENVDTNMNVSKIKELIKTQLDNPVVWNIQSMSAEGLPDSQECYSMPGKNLYVTLPDDESVSEIRLAITQVKAEMKMENE